MKTLCCLLAVIAAVVGLIEEKPMPKLMCDCFSENQYNASLDRLDSILYKCLQYYLMNTYEERWYTNVSESGRNYVQSLQREMAQELRKRKRRKRQASQQLYHGYRREIRTLTSTERAQFFAAVNALKNDVSVYPNMYQAIADFHTGSTLAAAHGGPAFIPWHRYYIYLIRQAEIIGAEFEWDYPSTDNPLHNPYTPFGGQLRELNNINGLLSIFGDVIYKYDEPLECPRCAQYGTFTCWTGQCVPTRRPDIRFNTGKRRRRRSAELIKNYDTFQHKTVLDETYQNSFLLDGAADVSRWVFIPIRLMYKRPSGSNFDCKPVHNGQFEWNNDVYATNNYSKINEFLKHDNLTGSDLKYDSGSGATKLFVQSDGLSYSGKYVDYGILDTRHLISETIAYVGVKNPSNGTSVAYVSAYDLHGLVCRPRCLDPGSKTVYHKECSGVVEITPNEPKMYGDTISDAVFYRYSFADDRTVPDNRYQEIFLTFVCEYSGEYPWQSCQI